MLCVDHIIAMFLFSGLLFMQIDLKPDRMCEKRLWGICEKSVCLPPLRECQRKLHHIAMTQMSLF